MKIDNSPRKSFQHRSFEHAHETRENNKFDPGVGQQPDKLLLDVRFELRSKVSRAQVGRRNPKVARDFHYARIRHIGNYNPAFGIELPGLDLLENRTAV